VSCISPWVSATVILISMQEEDAVEIYSRKGRYKACVSSAIYEVSINVRTYRLSSIRKVGIGTGINLAFC